MSSLLFLLDVLAVALIALWIWKRENPGGEVRVTLFDMTDDMDPSPGEAQAPAWRRAPHGTSPWRQSRDRWR